MFRRKWTLVLAFLLAAPASGIGRAAIVVDQQFRSLLSTENGAGPAVHDDRSTSGNYQLVTQTFTVGIAGKLVAVEPLVQTYNVGLGKLFVEIFPTTDGAVQHVETTTPLVSKSFTDREIYFAFNQGNFGDLYVDFSDTPIPVEIGEQYVICLRADGFPGTSFSWDDSNRDGYAGGSLYFKNQVLNEWRQTIHASDASFRTYVSVPEPSAIVLALILAGAAAWYGGLRGRSFSRLCRMFAVATAFVAVPVSAGTVTVDFTVGEDSKIAVPDFMTWWGDTHERLSNSGHGGSADLPQLELILNAGSSPLTLTATAYGLGAFVGPGCNLDVLTESPQQLVCTSDTGRMFVSLRASNLDEVDPPWIFTQYVALDDLTITGDDVDLSDMTRKNVSTPEPSSVVLMLILTAAGLASWRRSVR